MLFDALLALDQVCVHARQHRLCCQGARELLQASEVEPALAEFAGAVSQHILSRTVLALGLAADVDAYRRIRLSCCSAHIFVLVFITPMHYAP